MRPDRRMRQFSARDLSRTLDYPSLIDAIDDMFRDGCTVPVRHHHTIETPDGLSPTLLLMPAWRQGDIIGVKIVTVFPENGAKNLPAVMGSYMLIDGTNGTPLAILDGAELTARRTASASAVASRYLSRQDASRLLVVGTGVLSRHLIQAHASVRPVLDVLVWGRNPAKAKDVADSMVGHDFSVRAVEDLKDAVQDVDIISCGTLAREPLIRGEWLLPGQHLDLVGAFTPEMRESDDECIRRCSVFVDTREGALKEGGDLTQAMASGALKESDVVGDLFQLAAGSCPGRSSDDEITFFKSTGTALEDLAGAKLAFERADAL